MGPRARSELLRIMLRVAGDYGRSIAETETLREELDRFTKYATAPVHGAKVAQALKQATIWKLGCYAAWRQIRTLHDVGVVIDPHVSRKGQTHVC